MVAHADRVIVGLSGGVDSAVAALMLRDRGCAVELLFMKNWDEDDGTEYCTARADLADAERVADHLGLRLHTANFAAEYWDNVFEEFLREYSAGRTPNPDVLCNREIKFKVFIEYARALGADRVATGHYARRKGSGDEFRLLKGVDHNKDQSYFLHAVPREQLEACLFPIGDLTKPRVREIARGAGLHNHARKDSTGICFIGERRFRDFLARYLPHDPGEIHDTDGHVRGRHVGLAYYTLGQRQGLGIGGQRGAGEAPWYVVGKDARENRLIVSQDARDLASDWLEASAVHWLVPEPRLPLACSAKVRYRQADQRCTIERSANGFVRVRFDRPQRAVTPGQYVCFYSGEICLGGGRIETYGRTDDRAAA